MVSAVPPPARRKLWVAIALGLALSLVIATAIVSEAVQVAANPNLQALGGPGPQKALVLFHPSRDARFSDALALALAEGLKEAGFAVDMDTLNPATPRTLQGYALVGLVSNTYYWTPDRPTIRYLQRAEFKGQPVIAIMAGAGATERSARFLKRGLEEAGARVIALQSLWIWRPNDETRMSEPNRAVAGDIARKLGRDYGRDVLNSTPESQVRPPG